MQSALKILFIDDHMGLRDGLGFLLSKKNPDFNFLYAASKEECIPLLNENKDIKIAIVDLNLNGQNGLLLIPDLRKIIPDLNILIYTMFNDPIHIEDSLKQNVQGYITKDAGIEELEVAIISLSKGNTYYNKTASQVMISLLNKNNPIQNSKTENSTIVLFDNYKNLTKKEQEVFLLLAQKKETYEIAEILHKTEKTVINQKSLIYQKLNIRDRLDLIENAKLLGIIL